MRVVFFGTPDFAVPTLERLLSTPDFEVVGVVSQPDTRRGRGNQVSPSPVKAIAIAKNPNLKIWQEHLDRQHIGNNAIHDISVIANPSFFLPILVAAVKLLEFQAIVRIGSNHCHRDL